MTHRLQMGPCVWLTFADLKGTRQAVHKSLKKLVAAGLAEVIGRVNFAGEGGDCFVYGAKGARRQRANQLKHDVIEMLVITRLGLPFLRGGDVDEDLLQDFILVSEDGKRRLHGEIDSGASTYERIATERYPKYAGSEIPTLWVSCGLWSTSDRTRLEGLRGLAEGMPGMYFVTLAALLSGGLDAPAVNCDGHVRRVTDLLTDPEQPSPPPPP